MASIAALAVLGVNVAATVAVMLYQAVAAVLMTLADSGGIQFLTLLVVTTIIYTWAFQCHCQLEYEASPGAGGVFRWALVLLS